MFDRLNNTFKVSFKLKESDFSVSSVISPYSVLLKHDRNVTGFKISSSLELGLQMICVIGFQILFDEYTGVSENKI